MKKLFSILATFVLILSVCFGGTACKPENPGEEENYPVGKVCLNDFESYKPDFSVIRILGQFGAINVNKDLNYVKSGTASAKLQPLGGYNSMVSPMFYVPFKSDTFQYDYSDLSRIRQVTAEIYNSEETDVNMTFGLVMEAVNTDMVNKTIPVKYSLKTGWNTVTYDVDVSVISILYDIDKAEGVYFGFDSTGSRYIEDAPVLYLDDINLMFAQKPATVENLLSFDEGEICSFDKLYQRYIAYTEAENPAAEPEISVVKVNDYDTNVNNAWRKSVLALTTRPGNGGGTYQRLIFPENFMKAGALGKVDFKNIADAVFCFDIYACDQSITFYPEFFDSGYGVCYNKWAEVTTVGSWHEVRIPLSELKESMVTSPGFFRIAWGEYSENLGNLIFLFDNFRIEYNMEGK